MLREKVIFELYFDLLLSKARHCYSLLERLKYLCIGAVNIKIGEDAFFIEKVDRKHLSLSLLHHLGKDSFGFDASWVDYQEEGLNFLIGLLVDHFTNYFSLLILKHQQTAGYLIVTGACQLMGVFVLKVQHLRVAVEYLDYPVPFTWDYKLEFLFETWFGNEVDVLHGGHIYFDFLK